MELLPQKYKLIIFDWDGTLVDSLDSYAAWDKLYVKKFYGVDLPLEYFDHLAKKMKIITPAGAENEYFRYLDEQYGDGLTPMSAIWENLYSLSTRMQREIAYRQDAVRVLKWLRRNTRAHMALATNAEMRDIQFFSSPASRTAQDLSPIDFFDAIVTSDVVEHPKPHPETFQKIIDQYGARPSEVLIFEDSAHGIAAARATGADVVAIHADRPASSNAHIRVKNWSKVLRALEDPMS